LRSRQQAHSFVAVSLCAATVATIHSWRSVRRWFKGGASKPGVGVGVGAVDPWTLVKGWCRFAALSCVIGVPQLLLYLEKVAGHREFARVEGVWVRQGEPGPHTLWLEALGLFVPLHIAAVVWGRMPRRVQLFHIGLLVVFVVANVIVFQPWEVRVPLSALPSPWLPSPLTCVAPLCRLTTRRCSTCGCSARRARWFSCCAACGEGR
jgi:hypothetical protein